MNRESIVTAVNESLVDGFEIPPEKLTPNATLFEDLELDSLDAVDMMVYLEEKLSIKVDANEFKDVRSLEQVYDLVQKMSSNLEH